MSDPDIHAYSRALGSLEASVTNLIKTWSEQERNASEGRRELHRKFDDLKDTLKDEINDLARRFETMATDMTEIKPAIDEFKNQRQRAIGAKNFGKYLWGAMLTAAGGIGWIINEWLHYPKGH